MALGTFWQPLATQSTKWWSIINERRDTICTLQKNVKKLVQSLGFFLMLFLTMHLIQYWALACAQFSQPSSVSVSFFFCGCSCQISPTRPITVLFQWPCVIPPLKLWWWSLPEQRASWSRPAVQETSQPLLMTASRIQPSMSTQRHKTSLTQLSPGL